MKNYYRILDLPADATDEEVRAAYLVRRKANAFCESSGLGVPERELLYKRMALINEAYRVLSEPRRRAEYDRLSEHENAKTLFVTCRHCGHSEEIPLQEKHRSFDCMVCGELVDLAAGQSPQRRNGRIWQQVLTFLWLSRNGAREQVAPTLFHFAAGDCRFTLQCAADGDLSVFIYGAAAFDVARRSLPSGSTLEWDGDGCVGLMTLPASAEDRALLLRGLEQGLTSPIDRAYFSVGGRKHGFAEPNILFVSAVLDVSLSTATREWGGCNKNLMQIANRSSGDWEERLRFSHHSVYAKGRVTGRESVRS